MADDEASKKRWMTVATVRELPNCTEVAFLESARFYELSQAHPEYGSILKRLRESMNTGQSVTVEFNGAGSRIIQKVD